MFWLNDSHMFSVNGSYTVGKFTVFQNSFLYFQPSFFAWLSHAFILQTNPNCFTHLQDCHLLLKFQLYNVTSCTRPRVAVAQSHPIPSRPVPSRPVPYIKVRAYSNARLCHNCNAIGEELSEIVSGSTAS
jgi:hypothetical protein